jgi:hypothetical protein
VSVKHAEEAKRQRVAEIQASLPPLGDGKLTREEMHALLDACLDLSEAVEGGGHSGSRRTAFDEAKALAGRIGGALLRGAMGWTVRDDPAEIERLSDDPWAWRNRVVSLLDFSPTLLHAGALSQLTRALNALNYGNGKLPSLLNPTPKSGRGADPYGARFSEYFLLLWIEYEKARGRGAEAARRDVADAVGVTTKAVEKWKRPAVEWFGENQWNFSVADVKAKAAAGAPFLPGMWMVPEAGDPVLVEGAWSLAHEAAHWRKCKAKGRPHRNSGAANFGETTRPHLSGDAPSSRA